LFAYFTRFDELVTVAADKVGEYVPSRICRLEQPHSRTLSHAPAITQTIFPTAAMDEVARHFLQGLALLIGSSDSINTGNALGHYASCSPTLPFLGTTTSDVVSCLAMHLAGRKHTAVTSRPKPFGVSQNGGIV
jgi:hypothetical protein